MHDSHRRKPRGFHSRGYLPHCDEAGRIQFISFRLHDSMPIETIERWKRELAQSPRIRRREILRHRIDAYVDRGTGSCLLNDPRIATLVQSTLTHGDLRDYDLLAWCIMPNHVHTLIAPLPDRSLTTIVGGWKSYTAHEANRILERQGRFWFPDYFDTFMKSAAQLEDTIAYIEHNPVVAQLVSRADQWQFSSAFPTHRDRMMGNRRRHLNV
jgi:putative DNA methylase